MGSADTGPGNTQDPMQHIQAHTITEEQGQGFAQMYTDNEGMMRERCGPLHTRDQELQGTDEGNSQALRTETLGEGIHVKQNITTKLDTG